MAQQSKVKLSRSKLKLEGVQVNFKVFVGDWQRSVSISPINYKVFKKWPDIYAKRVVESIVEQIEYELSQN